MERLRISQAARTLGHTRQSIYKLIAQGKLTKYIDEFSKVPYLLSEQVLAYRNTVRIPGRKKTHPQVVYSQE